MGNDSRTAFLRTPIFRFLCNPHRSCHHCILLRFVMTWRRSKIAAEAPLLLPLVIAIREFCRGGEEVQLGRPALEPLLNLLERASRAACLHKLLILKFEGSADALHTDNGLLVFRSAGLAICQAAPVMARIGLLSVAAMGQLIYGGKLSVYLLRQKASGAIKISQHLIDLI